MATVYITEVSKIAASSGGQDVLAPVMPPAAEQTVAITGGSVQSDPFHAGTSYIQLSTDAICSIAFGSDPTATTSKQRLAANETRFYGVTPGQRVAVIANS